MKFKVAHRIKSVLGKGTAVEWARNLAKGGEDLIHMEIAEPNFAPPVHIIEAAKQAIEKTKFPYTDFQGLIELREVIADYLETEIGVRYDPYSEILVTSGAAEAIYITIQGIVDPGDEVILLDPTYLTFEPCIMLAGGIVSRVPLIEESGWALDLETLREKAGPKTKAIIINSPNNPTGTVFNKVEIEQIAEIACREDAIVIFDMVFDKIIYDDIKLENIAALPGMKDRTILIGGFSKIYSMSGLRVGWLAGNAEIISALTNSLHLYVSICASIVAQEAAIAALKGPQDWLKGWIREYQERRDILVQTLNAIPGIKCQIPKGGFFVFPNISAIEKDAYKFAQDLVKNAGIVVTPGSDYGPRGEGHVRMVFGAVSKAEVEECVKRLKAYFGISC
jgi:aminotransferase